MNKTLRNGLGAIVGLAVAGLTLGTNGCTPAKHIYDIPTGECRNTTCGEVCYEGIHGNMISAKINGKDKPSTGFPIANRLLYIRGCEMPVNYVSDDLLVVQNWQ
mgnify:CR=1 FL=1